MYTALAALALLLPTGPRVAVVEVAGPPGSVEVPPSPDATNRTVDHAPAPPPTAMEARRSSAAAGRGMIAHTAVTVPRGSHELSLRSVLPFAGLATLSTGLTDTTELTLEGALAVVPEGGGATGGGIGLKQVLARGPQWALSVGGSLRFAMAGSGSSDSVQLGQVGGTLSVCSDGSCGVMLSAGLSTMFASEADERVDVLSLGVSIGSPTLRVLADVLVMEELRVALAGIRVGNKRHVVDLGAVVVAEFGASESLPFVGYTNRM